ncbi:MAG: hypothetical protein F6K50_52595 [Moorea sp. SIO3I7]|nr:hypothetical protein [Moorena sp. SIO3I7]NEO60482.1 hypothetical protein [Moorena sp. SIO4G2]
MTQFQPDDEQWQAFLRQHRPTPPPAAFELEERVINAIAKSQPPSRKPQLWLLPSAIAVGLLMAWSGYRTHNLTTLEAFLEKNWHGVVGETSVSNVIHSPPADWMILANTGQ